MTNPVASGATGALGGTRNQNLPSDLCKTIRNRGVVVKSVYECTVLARHLSMDIPSAEAPAFVGMTVGAGMTWMFAGMTVVAE